MKRATLSNLPAANLGQAEPADLTDRLLERERRPIPAETGAGKPGLPATPAKRRRDTATARRAHKQAPVDLVPAGSATLSSPAAVSIQAALAAAEKATQALQDAGRSTPARYELALRFRLDALAHHVRQVREFVDGLMAR